MISGVAEDECDYFGRIHWKNLRDTEAVDGLGITAVCKSRRGMKGFIGQ